MQCWLAILLNLSTLVSAFVPALPNNVAVVCTEVNLFNAISKPQTPKVQVPEDFEIPEPRPLSVTEGTDVSKLLKNSLGLVVRLGTGAFVLGWQIDDLFYKGEEYSLKLGPLSLRDSSSVLADAPRPSKPLIVYEYDASPYCKRVREMVNILDLTVEYRPCPGARQGAFSEKLFKQTGRRTVPFLVDPNKGVKMFDSNTIINYLVDTYGPAREVFDRKALWPVTAEGFAVSTATTTAVLAGMPGAQRQKNARPDNENMQPLEFWAYECSPFCRPVKEKLCSLCLPHTFVSCSRGSANRDRMVEKTGRFQVPYLVDPNTGVDMFEGAAMVDYLDKVYTIKD